MRFNSIVLSTLLAFSATKVLGVAISSDLHSRSALTIEQRTEPERAATPPPPAEWYLKQVPGKGGQELYLTIDVLGVGYMSKTGDFKIHNYQTGKEAAQGSGTKALDLKSRRIGTNSLTICSLAMLISQHGALMAHLNPDFCTLFLDPTRTAAQKKEDEKLANYAAAKKSFDAFQAKCLKYYAEFNKLAGGKYEAVVVRGPFQKDDQYGIAMVKLLFKTDNPTIHYLEHDPHAKPESRSVMADFSGTNAVFSMSGKPVAMDIPA